MASLDDFLKDSPHLAESKRRAGDFVTLDVVITSVDDRVVDFVHLGGHFSALKEDVADVSEGRHQVANAHGKPAVLMLKSTARLEWKQYIPASELNASVPLGFALPTAAAPHFQDRSAIAAWSARVGYPLGAMTAANVIGGGTTCESYSNGVSDDSKHDDW